MTKLKIDHKDHATMIRIESIRKMEADLLEVQIPRLHAMQTELPYNHIAVGEQLAIVNNLQSKVSIAKPY